MPENFAVINLKVKLTCQPVGYFVKKTQIEKQTMKTVSALFAQTDLSVNLGSFEPRREKTSFLHMRKQRRRSASR